MTHPAAIWAPNINREIVKMARTLKAPEGILGISCGDLHLAVENGLLVDLDDATAEAIKAHDPGFADYDPTENEPAPPADLPTDKLNRKQLFAALRAKGVVASPAMSNDKLRELLASPPKPAASALAPVAQAAPTDMGEAGGA